MTTDTKIPFTVEISRMIELLASQIYPSPFALLRENVQNSFDAILLRIHSGEVFDPRIDVGIEPNRVEVLDNGIGMSRDDLRTHFWRAGASSKNTPEARAAGVVGTFGIGAMANFGVADQLTVETQRTRTNERIWSRAERATLSVTEDCIEFKTLPPSDAPGTKVTAVLDPAKAMNVTEAINYISEFVAFLPIAVYVNGQLVSKKDLESAVPVLAATWRESRTKAALGQGFTADIAISGGIAGELRVDLQKIALDDVVLPGRMILRQDMRALRTFRSSFGLATTTVSSAYQFGGVADFIALQPTAGREALTTDSTAFLQRIVSGVDAFVSPIFAERPESNVSGHFAQWVSQHGRYEYCANLRVRIAPGDSIVLQLIRRRSKDKPVLVYAGTDSAIIGLGSEDKPIVVVARGNPRHDCELQYLRRFCTIEEISDEPKVLSTKSPTDYSVAESALAFRVSSILASDYFLAAEVRFGHLSHGLPILITKRTSPIDVVLGEDGQSAQMLLDVFTSQYDAFPHLAKDFVRNLIFPRVADLVPSATRQGAEAFLRAVQRGREVFEYETADLENLTALWQDYLGGKVTMQQAEMAVRVSRSYQVIDASTSAAIRDIAPGIVENQAALVDPDTDRFEAMPPILRTDLSTDRKLLTIGDDEAPLKGYKAFLAIADRVRDERGDFFLQPHRTAVVWGGQRALFIFEHQSRAFGLYYDVQSEEPVSEHSGGGAFETSTIVMRDRIFIPLPEPLRTHFIPSPGAKKRLEVRCDMLYIGQD